MYNPVFFNEFTEQYIPFTDEMRSNSQFNSFQPSEEDTVLTELKDYGPEPLAININEATKENDTFRTALWTGTHLQVTLMSIDVNDDIGLEIHPEIDQFIRIEEGEGLVKMGSTKDLLDFEAKVSDDFAFMIPAGTWHNIINTGDKPLKAYSIYAPPQHPQGTVHETKADAQAAEESKETVQSPE
jgi:mannose-6-phosphate isomerase-like protein (cupin superfamily)